MIRLTGIPPKPHNLSLLREEAFARWPKLLDCNELNDGAEIAFYFEDADAPPQAEIDAFLAAHDGRQKSAQEQVQEARAAALTRLQGPTPTLRDLLIYLGLRSA